MHQRHLCHLLAALRQAPRVMQIGAKGNVSGFVREHDAVVTVVAIAKAALGLGMAEGVGGAGDDDRRHSHGKDGGVAR